jgi:hypothetical protein
MPSIFAFSRAVVRRRCAIIFAQWLTSRVSRRADPAKLAIIAQIRRLGDNFSSLHHCLSAARIRAVRSTLETP